VTGSLIVEGNTNTNTVIGTTTVQGDFDVEGTTRLEGRVDLTVGKLTTAASDTPQAGFNLPQGVAPTTPVNGDVWMTALGLFYRSGGTTKGPL
jgi:hypothetical protein